MSIRAFIHPGAQRVLPVDLLSGDDSSLPAALGTVQAQDLPGRPRTQGGPQTGPAHLHQGLPAAGVQRLHPLRRVLVWRVSAAHCVRKERLFIIL